MRISLFKELADCTFCTTKLDFSLNEKIILFIASLQGEMGTL